MTAAVTLTDVNKEFYIGDEAVRILHDINVKVQLGELTMLVGPSGCGKTTLISIISGILSATSGEITVLNRPLHALSDVEKVLFRRHHVGFIFQQYNLLPALTAAENAAMPLIAAGFELQMAINEAKAVLTEVGMEEHADKFPRQLSGGQQQRAAIARALVHKPQLIVCDEPTAALDAKSGLAVMEILRRIADVKTRAVLIVTHDNRIFQFADRIIEMSDGRILGN